MAWLVENAGSTEYNGVYVEEGTHNGEPYYVLDKGGYFIYLYYSEFLDFPSGWYWILGADGLFSPYDPGDEACGYHSEEGEDLPGGEWSVGAGGMQPTPQLSKYHYWSTPPFFDAPQHLVSYVGVEHITESATSYYTIRASLRTITNDEISYASCAVYKKSDNSLIQRTNIKEVKNLTGRWYYFDFENELELDAFANYYLFVQLWESKGIQEEPTYQIDAISGVGYKLGHNETNVWLPNYWPLTIEDPYVLDGTEDEYRIELSSISNISYGSEVIALDQGQAVFNTDVKVANSYSVTWGDDRSSFFSDFPYDGHSSLNNTVIIYDFTPVYGDVILDDLE